MKRILLFCTVLLVALGSLEAQRGAQWRTQSPPSKGYMGLSAGLGVVLSSPQAGISVNLFDFGYLFSRHVGICSKINAEFYPEVFTERDKLNIGAIYIGPLFSYASKSRRGALDLKPMLGLANVQSGAITSNNRLALSLGVQYRWHVARNLDLMLGGAVNGTSYYHSNIPYTGNLLPNFLSNLSLSERMLVSAEINIGVALRIR